MPSQSSVMSCGDGFYFAAVDGAASVTPQTALLETVPTKRHGYYTRNWDASSMLQTDMQTDSFRFAVSFFVSNENAF
jgi:hypothetical protein